MWQGFIGKQIRRSDRRILITNLGLLLVPLAIGISTSRYWHNFISGPLQIDRQALLSIKNPDAVDRYFVTVKGDRSIDTGFQQITQRKNKYTGSVSSKTVSAKYVGLIVDQKLLIVKSTVADAANTQFTGELVEISAEVQKGLVDDAATKSPQLRERILPFMLEETDTRIPGYISLAIALPLMALGAWNLQKVLRRRGKPEQHPIAKALSVKGDPASVASQVEQEMQTQSSIIGSTTITPTWFFHPTTYGLDAVPLENLVWVYKKVTTHRTYGIPTRKTWAAIVYDRTGGFKEVEVGKELQADELLQTILARVPWVIAGYSNELQRLWDKERSQLVAAVDLRRQQAQ